MSLELILARQLKLNFQNLVNLECFFSFVPRKCPSPYTYNYLVVKFFMAIGMRPMAGANLIDLE
jgi:hypothetical protein